MMSGGAAGDRAGPDLTGIAGQLMGSVRAMAGDRIDDARGVAGRQISGARSAAGRQISVARRRAANAAEVAATALSEKPRLRGVSHQWAFFVAVTAGIALVIAAPGGRATLAAGVYAFSLAALLGTSALYHRITWKPSARRWMRRLDHTMIFVLIAGTYTPFALLVLDGAMATMILVAVWACAAAGIVLNLLWWNAPRPVTAAVYLATGWIAIAAMPDLVGAIGLGGVGLIALGGALYTAGAIIYARRRPDPKPAVFGYHEVFHLLVIAAAAAHFAAVAIYALPKG